MLKPILFLACIFMTACELNKEEEKRQTKVNYIGPITTAVDRVQLLEYAFSVVQNGIGYNANSIDFDFTEKTISLKGYIWDLKGETWPGTPCNSKRQISDNELNLYRAQISNVSFCEVIQANDDVACISRGFYEYASPQIGESVIIEIRAGAKNYLIKSSPIECDGNSIRNCDSRVLFSLRSLIEFNHTKDLLDCVPN